MNRILARIIFALLLVTLISSLKINHDGSNIGNIFKGKQLTLKNVIANDLTIEYSKWFRTKRAVYNAAEYAQGDGSVIVFIDNSFGPPPQTITINKDYQYGVDNGAIFLVRNNAQVRSDGIYQWRFTNAIKNLAPTKAAAIAAVEAGSKWIETKYGFNVSGLFGDYLRDF